MKSIKIRHFYRMPLFMKLLMFTAIPVCCYLLFVGIRADMHELIIVAAIPLVISIVALGFYFSYGIKITSKNVVLMSPDMLKVFHYDDVIYIKIFFDNDSISGEIKEKSCKPYEFCFYGIDFTTSSKLLFLSHLWSSDLRLSKDFVEKSIELLSRCEKVEIRNYYKQ